MQVVHQFVGPHPSPSGPPPMFFQGPPPPPGHGPNMQFRPPPPPPHPFPPHPSHVPQMMQPSQNEPQYQVEQAEEGAEHVPDSSNAYGVSHVGPGKKNNAMVSLQVGQQSGGRGPYGAASNDKGLTLHFGGGPIGGGGQIVTSPIGIFKTLLLPLLPKPRVNLNGKVVFGVVLEKTAGFGKQKPNPIQQLQSSSYFG